MGVKVTDTEQDLSTTKLIDNIKLFKGDVVCPKCGESHDHEGILKECECTKCGADLTGVLF